MNQHAAITGAASGIGADCCLDLLNKGWTVYGLDIAAEGLARITRESQKLSGTFLPISANVADGSAIAQAFEQIKQHTPKLDALICSAGIFRTGSVLEIAESDFDALFAVNTKGAWLATRAAWPLLQAEATPEHPGRVIYVASIAAVRPKVNGGIYAASKVALTQLMRVLAVEVADKSVLVNALAPATIDTPLTQNLTANAARNGYRVSGVSPMGRVGQPADVTGVIRFLLSPDSNYITGTILPIDGGTAAAFRPS